MKCPKCGEELMLTPMSMLIDKSQQKQNYCFKCHKRYSDEDLKNIQDAEMIDDDMILWREAQKFR